MTDQAQAITSAQLNAHIVQHPELILAALAVFFAAKQFQGNILYAIPEGAFEVPDKTGQAAAEFLWNCFDFYEYFVVQCLFV